MPALLLALLLTPQPANSTTPAQANLPKSYKTSRSLQAIEKCLYEELADLGDATFMRSPGETILMIRNGEARPILIDITPPTLAITTRERPEIQARVVRCL